VRAQRGGVSSPCCAGMARRRRSGEREIPRLADSEILAPLAHAFLRFDSLGRIHFHADQIDAAPRFRLSVKWE
jgi:hypothetical protein